MLDRQNYLLWQSFHRFSLAASSLPSLSSCSWRAFAGASTGALPVVARTARCPLHAWWQPPLQDPLAIPWFSIGSAQAIASCYLKHESLCASLCTPIPAEGGQYSGIQLHGGRRMADHLSWTWSRCSLCLGHSFQPRQLLSSCGARRRV
jgi:hypothetical protein